MARRIQLRRDTAANWSSVNPLLAQGEIGLDLTNNKIKIGDGITYWNSLSYWDDKVTDLSDFQGNIIPSADNTYDLGSPTKQWRHVYTAGGSIYLDNIKLTNNAGKLEITKVINPGEENEAPDPDDSNAGSAVTNKLVNGDHEFVLENNGTLSLDGNPFTNDFLGDFSINNDELSANQMTIKTLDGDITIQSDSDVFIEVSGGTKRWSFANDGNITLPPGGDILNSTGSSVLGGGGTSDRLVSGQASVVLGSNNDLTIPGVIKPNAGTSYIDIYDSNIILQSSDNVRWNFDSSGIIRTSNTFTKTSVATITTTTPEIVWTASEDYVSGVKLQIQVEANEVGDSSGWHSQVCEAIIASRGYASTYGGPGGEPVMTVYGVTHTSTVPMVTFTVQRNPSTKKIEVVGTVTAAATAADLRIYSVETATRD